MKKCLVLILIVLISLWSCETTKSVSQEASKKLDKSVSQESSKDLNETFASVKEKETEDFTSVKKTSGHTFYVPSKSEVELVNSLRNLFFDIESKKFKIDYAYVKDFFQNYVGQDSFSALYVENCLRCTNDEETKKLVRNYMKENNLSNEYTKTLLKKYDSQLVKQGTGEKKQTRFVYNNEEYDENINLGLYFIWQPFKDEFHAPLFNNKFGIINYDLQDMGNVSGKVLVLLSGGGTNSMSITYKKMENVTTEEDLQKAFGTKIYEKKYKDNWYFKEIPLVENLETSGVTHFYIGVGQGPDIIPQIDCGNFIAYLHNEETKKVYVMDIFINFSKINMNYNIRQEIFDYLKFYPLLCYIYNQ